jgi:hypothetical protein
MYNYIFQNLSKKEDDFENIEMLIQILIEKKQLFEYM